jgi:hypothetical protein
MEAKTILSFKTCIKFNYFFKFLQAYLNLANISTFKKILKIQNGLNMADFLHKNS